jgi:cytidyltransferase-like protein
VDKKMTTTNPIGVIHGRFQGLHHGHMEYLLAGKTRCDFLIVGITNPDPEATVSHKANPHRSRDAANPFTYYERARMIQDSLVDAGVGLTEFMTVPFPINVPERIRFYAPTDALYFITIYDDWGRAKKETLERLGLRVDVMWDRPESEKPCSASEVRRRMTEREDWQSLVTPAVVRFVEQNGLVERVISLKNK